MPDQGADPAVQQRQNALGRRIVELDPLDPDAIAAGITEAIERRDELVPLGLEQASRFDWRETGRTMLAALVSARAA